MNLYIKVENNTPINYPITLENLLMIHPDFNETNNYGFIKFNRGSIPDIVEPYLITEYFFTIRDNECFEKYRVRNMTDEEKNIKINNMQESKPYESWIFNESKCSWEPPIPMPDGKYRWNEETISWQPDEA